MIGALILILLLFGITQVILGNLQKKHHFFDKKLMNQLFWYHFFFAAVYYLYAGSNNSDSHAYYDTVLNFFTSWGATFGTSTTFIYFLAYPFINFLGFSYEMIMVLFAWSGYLGFVYAYLFFRENISVKIKVFKKFDFLVLMLFLPNMHFWTASLGKGAPIFLGLMMFAYAILKMRSRIILLLLGTVLIFYIRPHVMVFVGIGVMLGYMSGKNISFTQKLLIFAIVLGGIFVLRNKILAVASLEYSENLLDDMQQFAASRSAGLSASGSGVDISSYPMPLKLFTFWFRPLFFDAPGILGIIVSFENLLYLFLFFKILSKDFIGFLRKSPLVVKMSITIFLLTSIAMTFVMSNLGIIMREKSMVMYFLFFVIYYYLAEKKNLTIKKRQKKTREVLAMAHSN